MKNCMKLAGDIIELLQGNMGTLVALSADGTKCEFRINTEPKDIAKLIHETMIESRGTNDGTRNSKEDNQ